MAGTLTGTAINAATTAASALNGTAVAGDANALVNAGDTFTVNGKTITFAAGDVPASAPSGFTRVTAIAGTTTGNVYTDTDGNSIVYLGSATTADVGDVLTAIDIASGVQRNVAGTLTLNAGQTASTVNGSGALVLRSSTGADLSFTGKADTLAALKLTTSLGAGDVTVGAARTTSAAPMVCMAIEIYLERHGFEVTIATAAKPASALEDSSFDLMIVDIFMPHMRGFESIRIFHDARRHSSGSNVGIRVCEPRLAGTGLPSNGARTRRGALPAQAVYAGGVAGGH